MTPFVATFFFALSLLVTHAQNPETSTSITPTDEEIVSISLSNYREGEAVKKRLTFAATSNYIINVTDITLDVSFLILQVHTYQYNVTLSYDKQYLGEAFNTSSLFGSNIGLFVKPKTPGPTQVYLENDNVSPVEALLAVVPYTKYAPIPGGCNMEFNIEVAPYQKLLVNDAIVTVDLQPASVVPTNNESERSCGKYTIRQDAYRVYLAEQDYSSESYFNAIASMLTTEDIMQNGQKIPPPTTASPLRRIYSVYPGVGAVYAAVANYEGHTAAYVPVFTYGCNYAVYPEDCQVLSSETSKVLCGLVFVLGFLCIFFGHHCEFFEILVIKSIFSTIIGYIIAKTIGSFDFSTNVSIGLGIAVLLVLALYILTAITVIDFGLLISQFTFGCICSAIHFYITGTVENNWVYWSIYLGIVLISLIIGAMPCIYVVTNAILSASLIILPIDYMAGSSLKYIIVNVIRRITAPQFNYAIISPPFQVKEISLTVFWILLAIYRIVNQFCSNVCCICCKPSCDQESTRLLAGEGRHNRLCNVRVLVYLKK